MAQGIDDDCDFTVTVNLPIRPNESALQLHFCNKTIHFGRITLLQCYEREFIPKTRVTLNLVSEITICTSTTIS